jgi:uncharacterized protein with ParB-like and HNH nuclease domain
LLKEHEIKSEKILVKDIFSTMWFRIPEYQRPYIWTKDEVNELLDDLMFAQTEKPNQGKRLVNRSSGEEGWRGIFKGCRLANRSIGAN